MFQQSRIIPELYNREEDNEDNDEDDEDEDNESEMNNNKNKKNKKKQKTTKDIVMHAAQKFSAQRKELKDQVIGQVMDAALPDMNEFNMDDLVIGKPIPPPPNKFIRCLQFFGCLTVSIHQAVENGSFEQLEKSLNKSALLLEKEKIEKDYIDEVNDKGHTALAEAVRIQRVDMVELLLSCHANPNIVDDETGMTPLLYSISNKSYRITTLLLKYGADPNISNFKGVTSLMIAASVGDINTCRLLVKYNVNIDFVDTNGWNALFYSTLYNSIDVCDYLLCEGIDKDMRDNKNRRALNIARYLNNGPIIALLESYKRRIVS